MHILVVRLEWVEWIINNLFDYRQKGPATAGPFALWEGAAGAASGLERVARLLPGIVRLWGCAAGAAGGCGWLLFLGRIRGYDLIRI